MNSRLKVGNETTGWTEVGTKPEPLTDAIGQPLRVGQAVVACAVDWIGHTAGVISRLDDESAFSLHNVCVDHGTEKLWYHHMAIIVIGSSVAEVDARVAGEGSMLMHHRNATLAIVNRIAEDAYTRSFEAQAPQPTSGPAM